MSTFSLPHSPESHSLFSLASNRMFPFHQLFLEKLHSSQDQISSKQDLKPHPNLPLNWLYIPYDQLNLNLPPLVPPSDSPFFPPPYSSEAESLGFGPSRWGVILIESRCWDQVRPYHRQRIALCMANQRHFAFELVKAGYTVRYHIQEDSISEVLDKEIALLGPLYVRTPAERILRFALSPFKEKNQIKELPHQGWLTHLDLFKNATGESPPWKMDRFYRFIRKKTGILMEKGRYVGGKLSYDADNRKPWKGSPSAPQVPHYPLDWIKDGVCQSIKSEFQDHPGDLDPASLIASHEDLQTLWFWVLNECMTYFGPYEDAMSQDEQTLFHSRISALLNLHRFLPAQMILDVEQLDIPLSSKEGWIRQILGWREFVYHVHWMTDGFRKSLTGDYDIECLPTPDDAGYVQWKQIYEKGEKGEQKKHGSTHFPSPLPSWIEDGGACPQALQATQPLPPVFWGTPSGLNCLDTVIKQVWKEGWSHHITRLMILANWATLLQISPRAITDWFWIAYIDAFDWVVEPNVLGMGTFATGEMMTTKPYISGSAYVNKMSDYCQSCTLDPKKNCPMTSLYWNTLGQNQEQLKGNPRIALPLASQRKRSEEKKQQNQIHFKELLFQLSQGQKYPS